MVILQYLSIRPASLVVLSTLVSRIGCFRGSVWIPSCLVVRWSMKLSIALLSNKAFSTVDRFAHTVKGMFIFCMLWYKQFGSFALLQVVEVEQFKNPLVQRTLHLGLCPGCRRLVLLVLPQVGRFSLHLSRFGWLPLLWLTWWVLVGLPPFVPWSMGGVCWFSWGTP